MRKLEVLHGKVTGKDENGKIVNYYKNDFIDVSDKEAKTLLATKNFKDVTDALSKAEVVPEKEPEGDIEATDETDATTVTIKKPKVR